MKKVLIFYGSYGGGHLSAARSIKEYINLRNLHCWTNSRVSLPWLKVFLIINIYLIFLFPQMIIL